MQDDDANFADLTGFKRDVIVAIIRKGGKPTSTDESAPYGLAIKREVEALYGEEVNHGRLYPNLDDLVNTGYVTKHEKDRRTNGYKATEKAVDSLAAYLCDFVGVVQATGNDLSVKVESHAKRQKSPAPADD